MFVKFKKFFSSMNYSMLWDEMNTKRNGDFNKFWNVKIFLSPWQSTLISSFLNSKEYV